MCAELEFSNSGPPADINLGNEPIPISPFAKVSKVIDGL
jgi:hypothetical protein